MGKSRGEMPDLDETRHATLLHRGTHHLSAGSSSPDAAIRRRSIGTVMALEREENKLEATEQQLEAVLNATRQLNARYVSQHPSAVLTR